MDTTHQTDNPPASAWNGPGGRAWVETQELLDRLFKPFEELLVHAVRTAAGARVLDVGCGTGSTTLAVARLPGVSSTGIDISAPMIEAARARAERDGVPARFICANAQTHTFDPASFDTIISRFGVMFFDDPAVAFGNLRGAATDDGELRFIAWRSAAENPFMTTAERAAVTLLPDIPERRPDAPGQFGLADPHRVHTVLGESGWSRIDIRPLDVPCTMRETELNTWLTRLGPVGLILQQADESTRSQVIPRLRAAFDPYVEGVEVRFNAACWMVSARAASRATRDSGATQSAAGRLLP